MNGLVNLGYDELESIRNMAKELHNKNAIEVLQKTFDAGIISKEDYDRLLKQIFVLYFK